MAGKRPGFFFYTGDWLKDPALSMCSESTRGIWIDLLCAMFENGSHGTLSGTAAQLARISRSSTDHLVRAITELSIYSAAVIEYREDVITVINRRMQRECNIRESTRKRVRNHRLRKVKRECNTHSSLSTSISEIQESSPVGSLSRISPSRTAETAPKRAKSARNTSERESKSRFSLKECEQYAASVKGIKQPKAYGKTIWRSGEDDDAIADFLGNTGNVMKKQPDKPVDVAEMQRLADELDRMGLDKQAKAVRAGIEASK